MHLHDHDYRDHASMDLPQDAVPDTASVALTDALHASFRVLKVILVIVFLMYLISGTKILNQNEQAVVFRFGRMREGVLGPGGFHATLPRPFDELVRMPVAEKRTVEITSQYLKLDGAKEQSARDVQRMGPLDPKLDGSLMTGDKGLIHGRWVVTFEIADLRGFVLNIYRAETDRNTARVIRNAVENAAVEVVAQMGAVQASRTNIDQLQPRLLALAQKTLNDLHSGIRVVSIDAETIPPVQTRASFENVTKASNNKRKLRDEARADSTWRLNDTAGAVHVELQEAFERYAAARTRGETARAREIMEGLEGLILTRATGRAGRAIREAGSFKEHALEDIRADVQEFRGYLVEYERNPELLFQRLWLAAQQDILTYPTLTKSYVPRGQKQIRLQINPDPEVKRQIERDRLQTRDRKKGDFVDREVQRTPTKPEWIK